VKFLTVGDPHPDGRRQVFFELNGQPREVLVLDRSLTAGGPRAGEGGTREQKQVAAPMPGSVVAIVVAAGSRSRPGRSCARSKR